MHFCTAINCMDGRIQLPVIKYLQNKFSAKFVDVITEAGPNKVLAEQKEMDKITSIFERIKISTEIHHSTQMEVIGHHDCAKNPFPKEDQIIHIRKAIEFIHRQYNDVEIIGLWVDEDWQVNEV